MVRSYRTTTDTIGSLYVYVPLLNTPFIVTAIPTTQAQTTATTTQPPTTQDTTAQAETTTATTTEPQTQTTETTTSTTRQTKKPPSPPPHRPKHKGSSSDDEVKNVTITKTTQDSTPALYVSWIPVNDSHATYTVCYSQSSGSDTESDPPSDATCVEGLTGTSTTLSALNRGTTYDIWVAAVSSDGKVQYFEVMQGTTNSGMLHVSK